MNWGYKILIVYFIFVSGILFLVFKSTSEKTDLVTTDYYAQELKYQQKIDESGRTRALSAAPEVMINGNQLQVHFPKDFVQKKLNGNLLLYCPADKEKDVRQNFSVVNEDIILTIPPANKGLHELQISWQADGIKYYFEKKIFI